MPSPTTGGVADADASGIVSVVVVAPVVADGHDEWRELTKLTPFSDSPPGGGVWNQARPDF